ncbi:MAG: methyl-accepting chemotaxis protein [Geminicoccaceae bacterium]
MTAANKLIAMLAASKVLIISAAAALGLYATVTFEDLAFDFYSNSTHRLLQSVVDSQLWSNHRDLVVETASSLAATEAFRDTLKNGSGPALDVAVKQLRRGGAIGQNEILDAALIAYDTDMKPMSSVFRNDPLDLPAPLVEQMLARDGKDKRRPFVVSWLDAGQPRLSAVVPVGGLRVLGYLGLHVDPLHGLHEVERQLDGKVTLLNLEDGSELAVYDEIEFASDAKIRSYGNRLVDLDGQPFAEYRLSADASTLTNRLHAIENRVGLAFAVIALVIGGGAVLLFARFARRSEAEAIRAKEAEAEFELAQREALDQLNRELADRLEQGVGQMIARLTTLTHTMRENSNAASEAAGSSQEAVSAAREKADNTASIIEDLAKVGEELQRSISEISAQSVSVLSAASATRGESEQARTAISDLSQAIGEIGEVAAMISDIADRTNLLALNATIEAARAGDAGRGFAVVAQEVKSLAVQTSDATAKIITLQNKVNVEARAMEQNIEQIGASAAEIDNSLTAISGAIEEQTAVTGSVAQSIARAASNADGLKCSHDTAEDATSLAERSSTEVGERSVELAEGLDKLDALAREVVRELRGNHGSDKRIHAGEAA